MGEKRGWIGGWDAWSEVGDRYLVPNRSDGEIVRKENWRIV